MSPREPTRRSDGAVKRSRRSDAAVGEAVRPGHDWPGSGQSDQPGHDWPGSERAEADRGGSVVAGHEVPLGYLITFSTRGTWLHGDPRGSVDRDHNIPGTPFLEDNPRRAAWERGQARHAPVKLDAVARRLVQGAIAEVCAHRNWTLHTIHVRSNHVHAVVSAPVAPEVVLHDLKAYGTRALRGAGRAPANASPWTTGGSKRCLWTPEAMTAACRYVDDAQGADI